MCGLYFLIAIGWGGFMAHYLGKEIERFDTDATMGTIVGSMFFGFIWPVSMIGFLFYSVARRSHKKSEYNRKVKEKR